MKQKKDSAHRAPAKKTAAGGDSGSAVGQAVAQERARLRRILDNSMSCMSKQRDDDRLRFEAAAGERYAVLMTGILADALGSEDAGHLGLETIRKLDRWWETGARQPVAGDSFDYWCTVRQALAADCAILGLKTLRRAEAELLFQDIAVANKAFAAALGADFAVSAICANRDPDDYSDVGHGQDSEPENEVGDHRYRRPSFVREQNQREAV